MSKHDGYETALLSLVFQSKAITNLALASTVSTSLWFSLHTADPLDSGGQNAHEVSFGGYGRIATSRTTTDWVVSNGVASPLDRIQFANQTGTSTTETITHFCVGLSATPAGLDSAAAEMAKRRHEAGVPLDALRDREFPLRRAATATGAMDRNHPAER
jgi:hypothetical protein